jgi:hypothetical protein
MVNVTKLGIRTDMTIDNEKVAVEGLIGGDFFLQLNKPASLGTPISFAYWLRDTFQVEGLDAMLLKDFSDGKRFKRAYDAWRYTKNDGTKTIPDEINLPALIEKNLKDKGFPPQVLKLMESALLARLIITDLLIDIKKAKDGEDSDTRKVMFGLAVDFEEPLPLLPNIDVNKLSIMVMNAPKDDFKFPERLALPASQPLPLLADRATGYIEFSDNPVKDSFLKLNGEQWAFTDQPSDAEKKLIKVGSSLDDTLKILVSTLKKASAGEAAKCGYSIESDRLRIRFNAVGAEGNEFTLQVSESPDANAKVSGSTLKGGYGEVEAISSPTLAQAPTGSKAKGSIKFTENPADNSTVTLGGTEWKFVTKTPKAKDLQTKIEADAGATVAELAKNLTASGDASISNCEYEADTGNKELKITFKKVGRNGNEFAIVATPESNGQASGATLTGGA